MTANWKAILYYELPVLAGCSRIHYVIHDLQWKEFESPRLEPAEDLPGGMAAAIERPAAEDWQIEAEPRFGFAFIRRDCEHRLLTITPRDPYDNRSQSLTPFK